jgi:hypothetical protein
MSVDGRLCCRVRAERERRPSDGIQLVAIVSAGRLNAGRKLVGQPIGRQEAADMAPSRPAGHQGQSVGRARFAAAAAARRHPRTIMGTLANLGRPADLIIEPARCSGAARIPRRAAARTPAEQQFESIIGPQAGGRLLFGPRRSPRSFRVSARSAVNYRRGVLAKRAAAS